MKLPVIRPDHAPPSGSRMGVAGLTKARRRPELQDFTGVNILGRFTEVTSFLFVVKRTYKS